MADTGPATLSPLDTPGQRLKFLRKAREMTQQDLAKKVFTTQPTVARWEKDEFLPHIGSQILLAEALGVSRAFIFGERAA